VLTPNPNGRLPTSRFIGDPDWDRYDSERSTLGYLFEHRFDGDWTVRQNLRYSRNTVDYRSLYGDSFNLPGGWAGDPVGQRLFGRFADATLTRVRMLDVDQHLEGRFATGAVNHQVLAGLDLSRLRQTGLSGFDAPVYAGGSVPLIDAYDPVYPAFTPPAMADVPASMQRQTGVYLQDQMKFANWILAAGLRHDRAVNGTEGTDDESSRATTKRIGLMYAADNGLSPYLSYSESFTPVASIGFQTFVPLRGKQWEAGFKYEPSGADLAFNAAVYDLRELNQVVEVLPKVYAQLGETKAKGVELELKAAVTRSIDLTAHYNYTDLDEKIEAVPRHQAAAWAKRRFSLGSVSGFSAGAGVRWMSSFHDGAAPTVPALTLLDAMLAWETSSWRYALNVNNLTDKTYVSTCLSRGDCWFGARRNIVASASYRF
jgi:iron complex outermembrane receptor protein